MSEKLLSQLVFKKLAILEVNGQINKIQDDLFKCFNENRKTITKAITLAQGVITNSIKMKQCSKSRIVKMIILNGINFLVLRLPLSLIDFYSLIYNVDRSKNQFYPSLNGYIVCRTFLFCESLQRIFHFLYLISFIIQFYIFFKLDGIFKENVKNFLKIKA